MLGCFLMFVGLQCLLHLICLGAKLVGMMDGRPLDSLPLILCISFHICSGILHSLFFFYLTVALGVFCYHGFLRKIELAVCIKLWFRIISLIVKPCSLKNTFFSTCHVLHHERGTEARTKSNLSILVPLIQL